MLLCLSLFSCVKELLQYKTVGGKVKTCELTVHWPEEMTFLASGHRRLEAESKAAALACLRFKVGLRSSYLFVLQLEEMFLSKKFKAVLFAVVRIVTQKSKLITVSIYSHSYILGLE